MLRASLAAGVLLALAAGQAAATGIDADALYLEHCAVCHGAERLGGTGPALLPDNLGRLRPARATEVIAGGLPQTQMPAFHGTLGETEIAAIVELIYTPPEVMPVWGMDEILASHRLTGVEPAAAPIHDADPMNLFVVVETGDHHITILDGDRFEPLRRLPTAYALHGGPKFSPDGRFVYHASRDGWVEKVDLWGLERLAEVRAGINTRNLALSHDGRFVLVGNYLPPSLTVLDAQDLRPLAVIPVADINGVPSRVSAVYAAPPRQSFIVALKDVSEIWEIPVGPKAVKVTGLAHSSETGAAEVLAAADPFPVRRMLLDEPVEDFFFTPDYRMLLGSARDGGKVVAVQLDVGRKIKELPLPGMPHLGSAAAFAWQGRQVMATPHLHDAALSVIDTEALEVVDEIATLGPGFFLRSHPATPYAWVDVFFGPDADAVQVLDTRTLELVRTIRPSPGITAGHVEFTADGAYALVSVWDVDQGALVIYDSQTLEEVKRLPMRRPVGKYNVTNRLAGAGD
jgi:mono/diheme cytochrome c family protein/DNA-binding beta-propeller fold protein YncE